MQAGCAVARGAPLFQRAATAATPPMEEATRPQPEDAVRFRKPLVVLLTLAITAIVVGVVRDFLLALFLAAVFSSLLGVWQAVPYLFADTWGQLRLSEPGERHGATDAIDTSLAYRGYLAVLALVPMAGLFFSFREIQKL